MSLWVSPLMITLLFLGRARATNDWSIPCLSGQCSYDLQNSTASGSLQLSGSPNAISDLTTAAGWTILDCNSTQVNQDIRVVCTGNTDDCGHLYSGGAENKLVRLPQNCGAMPFARVAKEWTHENQTIPAQVQATIQKRDNSSTSTPTVRGIRLDVNFAAIDPTKNGNVTMFIQGSNAAGGNGNFTVTPAAQRRGLLGDIANDIKGASSSNLACCIALSFSVNKSTSHTVDFDKAFTLFDQSIDCPATGKLPDIKGEVKVAVEPKVHAVVGFGVVAAGTVVPPKVTDFGLFASLDGSLNGTLTLDASASATLDSGKIQIFQVGIPGLDFPGILSIGPSFVVNAQGIATIDTDLKLGVDLAYNINNAKLFFPPGKQSSGGDFAPANTDLTLAATPNVAASGSVEAHIIPSLQFGLDALNGLAKATINLDLDTSAKLTLSLQAGATISTSTTSSSNSNSTNVDTSFGGCVDLSVGLAVTAGADATFLSLFDQSTSVTLFQKDFDLFNKCFGSSANKKRWTSFLPSYPARRHPRDVLARRALKCSTSLASDLTSIVDQVVQAKK
ncbi:hypothetical protein BDY19DRAFT_884355 [Irpex rosettiformis]|uniref:Uncharacterized protein n=1 Tax=Irpex rosettiformis TaxID=378272 RepID=A0ACB8UD17_9APHY|nr:hypothetical protein BDY19DRAFT_884355 [Irpex rosettiformis]